MHRYERGELGLIELWREEERRVKRDEGGMGRREKEGGREGTKRGKD
jgi:hypothetical protein